MTDSQPPDLVARLRQEADANAFGDTWCCTATEKASLLREAADQIETLERAYEDLLDLNTELSDADVELKRLLDALPARVLVDCDVIEVEPVGGVRTFIAGPRRYMVDCSSPTEPRRSEAGDQRDLSAGPQAK